jgi:hypothetical protein
MTLLLLEGFNENLLIFSCCLFFSLFFLELDAVTKPFICIQLNNDKWSRHILISILPHSVHVCLNVFKKEMQ